MFKRICVDMLKEENYLDALAYLCTRIDSKKTLEGKENEFDRVDSILWNLVDTNAANKLEDASGQALRISTALQLALDYCYDD